MEYRVGHNLQILKIAIILGNITGTYKVGGICGDLYKYASITRCYNKGNITNSKTSTSNKICIGGITGNSDITSYKIENCFNTGNVTENRNYEDQEIYVGNISGHHKQGNIENCYYINNGIEEIGLNEDSENTINIKEVIKGDSNLDGQVDIKDIMEINLNRLNKKQLEWINEKVSDTTSDDQVDIKDIMKINLFRLGKITTL